MAATVVNVTSTATVVGTFAPSDNQTIRIHCDRTSSPVTLGSSSGVTATGGLVIGGGSTLVIQQAGSMPTAALTIYGIIPSGASLGRLLVSSTTS